MVLNISYNYNNYINNKKYNCIIFLKNRTSKIDPLNLTVQKDKKFFRPLLNCKQIHIRNRKKERSLFKNRRKSNCLSKIKIVFTKFCFVNRYLEL